MILCVSLKVLFKKTNVTSLCNYVFERKVTEVCTVTDLFYN